MSGIRARPHQRLLDLLIDTGAASFYRDRQDNTNFSLFMPLLGELTLEGTDELITDFTCLTRPFMRQEAERLGNTLSFRYITHPSRFDEAMRSGLADLNGYDQRVPPEPRRRDAALSFPLIEWEDWHRDTPGERARDASLLGVGYAAFRVRKEERLLDEAEREKLCRQLLPEYNALLREAEELALRVVRLNAICSNGTNEDYNEWLSSRGHAKHAPYPYVRPAKRRCDTD